MESMRCEGLLHHIGMSNVTINHLVRALEVKVPISWVQVEMHPQYYDPELLAFCKKHSIVLQAWAPLGRGRLKDDHLLSRIADKYAKTAPQIALKWYVQHEALPLPSSKNPEHISQNLEISGFSLTHEEMEEIDQQAKNGERERVTEETGVGFTDEFDFSYEECWPVTEHP